MDVSNVATAPGRPDVSSAGTCPRCGEGFPATPPVLTPSFGGRALRRCLRCGTRVAIGGSAGHVVFTCESCGLPFLADALLPHAEHRCEECAEGRVPPDLPDIDIAAAAENEVRTALASRWRFVTSSVAQPYLDRIARLVAARIESAPPAVRVVVVAAAEHRTLALPSGALLVSTGLLEFLEDEAELAFALGHEIAHAGSGEVAVRLVRLGFRATARERGASDGLTWTDAAVDLVRLGYGRKRERDADARAIEALLGLEYDPHSAIRYLERLHAASERSEPSVAETIVAHAAPRDRIRRIERALYGRVGGHDGTRVNREPFRRAVGRGALKGSLVDTELDTPHIHAWGVPSVLDAGAKTLRTRVLVAVAVAAAGLVALVTWLLL
jgi:peptidase M48-like protein